jgi:SAM-dependent methyltransferase
MTSNFKDYFSTKSDSYASYRPKYPLALAEELAKLCKEKNTALDCGCGSGQLSVLLADQFDKVIATDASSKQIENATPHPKLTYKVAPAESTPLPDHSVDIITVAQAAHWLDLEKFYTDAKRLLKPKGVIALITYQNTELENPECNKIVQDFYGETLDQYWPPERRLVEAGYKTLDFPFHEIEFPEVLMSDQWSFHQLYGYITTWSAFKAFEAAGGAAKINLFKEQLANTWKNPDDTQQIRWPLSLRVGLVD